MTTNTEVEPGKPRDVATAVLFVLMSTLMILVASVLVQPLSFLA